MYNPCILQQNFQLYIEVWEDEGHAWRHDLIAKIFAEGSREVGPEFSSTEYFHGGYVILGLQFRVTCINGWSGTVCNECAPTAACCEYYINLLAV